MKCIHSTTNICMRFYGDISHYYLDQIVPELNFSTSSYKFQQTQRGSIPACLTTIISPNGIVKTTRAVQTSSDQKRLSCRHRHRRRRKSGSFKIHRHRLVSRFGHPWLSKQCKPVLPSYHSTTPYPTTRWSEECRDVIKRAMLDLRKTFRSGSLACIGTGDCAGERTEPSRTGWFNADQLKLRDSFMSAPGSFGSRISTGLHRSTERGVARLVEQSCHSIVCYQLPLRRRKRRKVLNENSNSNH